MKKFSIVVAATHKAFGIGKNGAIPWRLPGDMKYFKNITTRTTRTSKAKGKARRTTKSSSNNGSGSLSLAGQILTTTSSCCDQDDEEEEDEVQQNAVIMGRKTWESLPKKYRPLPHRLNIVLTSQRGKFKTETEKYPDTRIAHSLKSALELVSSPYYSSRIESVFVIGGGNVYREALELPECSNVYLTRVYSDIECDTFFAQIPDDFVEKTVSERNCENDIEYEFITFERKNPEISSSIREESANGETKENLEEMQYLDLIREIIENGNEKGDRTGTGTLAKFGCSMRFSLKDDVFPLLTTKRTFWRGVAEELLWFISGSTNGNILHQKGVKIWDGNGSREYLDKIGLSHREEGDLGPVYGFQWRHFGAKYIDMHTDYSGKGFDQLADCIQKIKTNPNDRRIIMSAWNPADLHLMALPPCHMFCQFYVANGELSCQMYQRSCDMGLGVPFNIASYALLTRLIAQVCDLLPGEFIHTLGDAHVYVNHIDPLKEQLKRKPRPFPKLKINPDVKDINCFKFDDFSLVGYKPHKKIPMKMAV